MRNRIFHIALLLTIAACNKQQLQIDLSESDKVITAEGFITDSLETQYFKFNWSTNLGDSTPVFIDDMSFQVVTDDETFNYVHDYQGRYKSTVPFKGVPGKTYDFQFSYQGEFYSAETVMPYPIDIDSIYFNLFVNEYYYFDELRIQLDSESDQYFGYDLYQMVGIDPFSSDTIWEDFNIPVYLVTPVLAAPNQVIKPPSQYSSPIQGASSILKMEIYSFSTDIGEYLLELQNYMTSGQANSQFFNPPSFFSKDAYGMAYGISKKTVVFTPEP